MDDLNQSTKLISTINYKRKKTCDFYEDRLVFANNTIYYKDIEVIDTSIQKITYNFIIGTLDGRFFFSLKNDQKKAKTKMIAVTGFSIIGIGNRKAAEDRYASMYQAVYQIVAKAVAEHYVDYIKRGNSLTVGKIDINATQATYKNLIMNKENFHTYTLAHGGNYPVFVHQDGKSSMGSAFKPKNMILLPYIFTALYGSETY